MPETARCTRKHASTTARTANPQRKYQHERKRVHAPMRVTHCAQTRSDWLQLHVRGAGKPVAALGCRWPRPAVGPCAAHLSAVPKDQLVPKYSRSRGASGLISVGSSVVDPPLKTILQLGKQRRKHRRCAQSG